MNAEILTILACALLLIAALVFVFYSERQIEQQHEKTRLEYLEERKEVVYENLRDLNFEYRAGKYPEEDYAAQRAALENEASETLTEIDLLQSSSKGN
jgi:hypothetical protein